MAQPALAETITPAIPAPETVTLETRFGPIEVTAERAIRFPNGLPGFGDLTSFALAALPDPRFGAFKLLQSLDDTDVSFLVTPLDAAQGPIARSDLAAAAAALGIGMVDLVCLLIVTVRQTPEGIAMTANLRAPVLIDAIGGVGYQFVLQNQNYSIRHPL